LERYDCKRAMFKFPAFVLAVVKRAEDNLLHFCCYWLPSIRRIERWTKEIGLGGKHFFYWRAKRKE